MKINQDILQKYREGTCTAEELDALKVYFEQNKLDDFQLILLDDWNEIDEIQSIPKETSARMWDRLNQSIPADQIESKIVPLSWYKWRRIAAAALIVVVALSAFWLYNIWNTPPILVEFNPSKDENRRVELQDGSVVWLGPGSSLRFQKGFSKKARAIELSGEAFFQVKKDQSRPFSVSAEGIRTTALGTSFRVKAKNNSPEVRVALITGSVMVQSEKNTLQQASYFLTPGKQFVLLKGSNNPKVESVDNQLVLDLRDGKLVFEDAPLKHVLLQLKAIYHVDIDFKSKMINDCIVNTSFPKNEPVKNILTVLAFANSLEVTQPSKNHFNLLGQGCSN
ncbi:MAG: FecR domain-containing protein [Haliscomenobacter sp.]|uniref:FecR family protein n=1 Tax=Haliscomenobacter sp. TaxID=2717303 RepID=UPI0029BB25B3|nr:FecR domain-containing protein [Haliscomenobacter sp.]MDX2071846.1 FecR domain-containing protein [Haliscomenobacter sp.]